MVAMLFSCRYLELLLATHLMLFHYLLVHCYSDSFGQFFTLEVADVRSNNNHGIIHGHFRFQFFIPGLQRLVDSMSTTHGHGLICVNASCVALNDVT